MHDSLAAVPFVGKGAKEAESVPPKVTVQKTVKPLQIGEKSAIFANDEKWLETAVTAWQGHPAGWNLKREGGRLA